MKKLVVSCLVLLLSTCVFSETWTTLNYPEAIHTEVMGIQGTTLVGTYWDNSTFHGFVYNGTNWTAIDKPSARSTQVKGIDGTNLAGWYKDSLGSDHGFVYNGSNWNTVDKPSAISTHVFAIDGENLVGEYYDSYGIAHGFLYNGLNWTTLDAPGSQWTNVYDIDGHNLVGYYHDASGNHGFLYDLITKNWTTLNAPIPAGTIGTYVQGISNNNLVGVTWNGNWGGFLYNLDSEEWIILDAPGSGNGGTKVFGIDGMNAVGYYYTGIGGDQGFLCTIPEPATLSLLGLGLLALRRKKKLYFMKEEK